MIAMINLFVNNLGGEEFFTVLWMLTMASVAIQSLCSVIHQERDYDSLPLPKVERHRKTKQAPRLISRVARFPEEAVLKEMAQEYRVRLLNQDTVQAEREFFGVPLDAMLAYVQTKPVVHPWALGGYAY
jgi:hypothetical protein